MIRANKTIIVSPRRKRTLKLDQPFIHGKLTTGEEEGGYVASSVGGKFMNSLPLTDMERVVAEGGADESTRCSVDRL